MDDTLDEDDSIYLSMPSTNEEEITTIRNSIIYLRTQLMQQIESKDAKPNCDEILHFLLHIDVPLQNKCHSVLINDLLSKNSIERENLNTISSAFNILYRYGRNLLKDHKDRPQFWKAVKFSNSVFHTKVDSLLGGRHILCQLGYTQEIDGGLAFPEDAEPHRDTVVEITADLLIGKYELDIYMKGHHPFPRHIESHVSLNARFPQTTAASQNTPTPQPTGPTANTDVIMDEGEPIRRPPQGGVALFPMPAGVGPHMLKKASPPRPASVTVAPKPATVQPTNDLTVPQPRPSYGDYHDSREVCRVCESFPASILCNCRLCSNSPYCSQCFHYWHESPQSKQIFPTLAPNAEVKAVATCMMCGDRQEMFKYCAPCKKQHCDNCDRAWHSHPDRKSHARTDIEAAEPSAREPSPQAQIQASQPSEMPPARIVTRGMEPVAPTDISSVNEPAPRAQIQTSQPSEMPPVRVVARGVEPATPRPLSVQDLIRQNEVKFTNAQAGFPQDRGEGPKKGSEFDKDPRVIPSSRVKDFFEGSAAGAYENAQIWTRQLIDEIGNDDTTAEKTRVVIQKKDGGYGIGATAISGPASIPEAEISFPSMVTEVTPPPVPPKPSHLAKGAKPASGTLEGLLKVDPEVRQVMLDMELEKLESEIRGLRKGIEIYTKMKNEENPECKRMKSSLTEKIEEFYELCQYRVKFGMGNYSLKYDDGQAESVPIVPTEQTERNKSDKLPPKQAWEDKNVAALMPKPAFPNIASPPRIPIHGLPRGESRDDEVFTAARPPPPVIPLESLGSFQPISLQMAPKQGDIKKPTEKPQSKWECQFCTFHNPPGETRCSMCEHENINPKYIEDDIARNLKAMTLDDKASATWAKGFHQSGMLEYTPEEKEERDFQNKFSQTLGRKFPRQEAEMRLHSQQTADGQAMIRKLRNFEGGEYDVDQFEIAANHSDDWQLSPFDWMQQYWDTFKENVLTQASHCGSKDDPNVLGNVTIREIEAALMECKDVDAAIEKCRIKRKEMIDKLKEVTDVPVEDLIKMIGDCKGDEEEVITKLNETVMQETLAFVWSEEEPDQPLLQDEFQEFIKNEEMDKERRLRALLVIGRFDCWEGTEMVLDVLHDSSLDLTECSFEDIVDAARNANGDYQRCKSFLEQECEMCFTLFPMNKIRNLIHCQCKICEGCVTENFQYAARDREVRHMACPVCGVPDLQNDEAKAETHFQILDLIIKNLLEDDVYQLFQKKLRDYHLMKEPNFRWCAHCECGIIFHNEGRQLKMTCPECRQATCFNCKDKWEAQHEGLTCEEFKQWKYDNDPELQAAGLARHLQENGIDCPNCKFRYALARGGCMHFTCTQCGWEFCSGCNNPFKRGDSCTLLQSCASSGLHCHHPRDCLFYLRDNDVATLKLLLENNNVGFKSEVSQEEGEEGATPEEETNCSVLEQKETPDGLKDERCGKPASKHEAGLCKVHYKEYLVMLINKHTIDPVEIMDVDQLQRQLERAEVQVPHRKKKKESLEQYKKRLQEYIKRNIPLTPESSQQAVIMNASNADDE